MRAFRLRTLVGCAAASAVVMTSVCVTSSAGATQASLRNGKAHPGGVAVTAPGKYFATFAEAESPLTIKADPGVSQSEGTFRLPTFHDSGTWVLSGTTISMVITKGNPDKGFVLVGTVTPTGITPAKAGQPGDGETDWVADRLRKPQRGHGSSIAESITTRAATSTPLSPNKKAAGTYDITLVDAGGAELQLILANDPDISKHEGVATFASPADTATPAVPDVTATWLVMKTQIAIGISKGPSTGTVFVGTVGKFGISSPAQPALYAITGEGLFRWYGSKLPD